MLSVDSKLDLNSILELKQNTHFDMLWLSQGNIQSAGSIETNDTLADRGGFNPMGFQLYPFCYKGIARRKKGLWAKMCNYTQTLRLFP